MSATDIRPQLSSSDWARQFLATAAGFPYTPGTAAAGEAVGVGDIDKSPKALLGAAEDAADDDFDDGGDAVSDVEHAATRQIPATPMQAFNAALRAAVSTWKFNTRLVKTKSLRHASFRQ
jgi:hypothetical protein